MDDVWAALADPFVEGAYATVKGRVRTYVVHQQLLKHLPPPPATVLDVGGGAGHQSRPLARAGYDVTLLDSSPAMLGKARELLAKEPSEVRRRVSLLEGRGQDAAALTEGRRVEAVLCHGVLMYLADPALLVASLCACAAPGGVVSLLALNARAMAVRPAMERRWPDAVRSFEARQERGVLGMDTRADTVEELSQLLGQHACGAEAWYGVWLFSDWLDLAGHPLQDDELLGVAEVELLAGNQDPYRQLARLFHIVGRRATG
ncbi:MAG: methyltransferase [Acidimicrobiales bacterium]